MSTGAVVALAMDLCERGAADYGLAFGDAAGYLAAPGLIARREGWGAELALGARDLAALKGRPELAPHIKGLELPSYDPRGTFGMGLGYATSDRGACHMRAFTAADDILGGEAAADSLEGKPALIGRAAGLQRPRLDRRLVRQHVPRHGLPRRALPAPLGPRDLARGAHDARAPGSGTSAACSTCARASRATHDRLPAILSVPHPGRRGGGQDA